VGKRKKKGEHPDRDRKQKKTTCRGERRDWEEIKNVALEGSVKHAGNRLKNSRQSKKKNDRMRENESWKE